MIVVVGGQARKVGKTTAMCDIIAATREAAWVAVKLTAHAHTHEDQSGSGVTDTDRYLAAGARQAMLLGALAELPEAPNLIVESNAAAERIRPDLFVFITDPANPKWKESAMRVFSRADIVAERRLSAADIASIATLLLQRL